ncbi:UNVERIFIED_CONTAM: hypothetical protein K2H54_008476, partial [Gekko kuhli]
VFSRRSEQLHALKNEGKPSSQVAGEVTHGQWAAADADLAPGHEETSPGCSARPTGLAWMPQKSHGTKKSAVSGFTLFVSNSKNR